MITPNVDDRFGSLCPICSFLSQDGSSFIHVCTFTQMNGLRKVSGNAEIVRMLDRAGKSRKLSDSEKLMWEAYQYFKDRIAKKFTSQKDDALAYFN